MTPFFFRGHARLFVAPICLVGCVGVFAIATPQYPRAGNIGNVLSQMWVLGLLASGQAFPMVTRGFDISVGAVSALSSTVAALSINLMGLPGIVFGPLAGLACGTLNGILIGLCGMQPVIATLSVMIGARGLATLVSDGQPIPLAAGDFASNLALVPWFGLPPICWGAMIVVACAAWIMGYSLLGRQLMMLGSNSDAVHLVGCRAASLNVRAYQISGLLAGFAGVLITLRAGTGLPSEGAGMEMQSIAAAMIGGTSLSGGAANILFVVFGATFIQALLTGLNLQGVSPFLSQTAIGLVIIASGLVEFSLGRVIAPSSAKRRSL
jgi:ribose transport system permease protein